MRDNYDLFPKKQILPYDGMSINAVVWNEAHYYHAQSQNAHQYFLHGTGIVTGLDVIASDPPDSIVYILPGVAIDTAGKMVVLAEPVAYDLGEKILGDLRLLLIHREVKTTVEKIEGSNPPAYKQSEFVIVARTESLDAPHVELARIQRDSAKADILDAKDPHNPQPNGIDLRFRGVIGTPEAEHILAGVVYLGSVPEKTYDQGLINLARPLAAVSPLRLIVENDVALTEEIFKYQFLYLVVTSASKLTKDTTELMQTYLDNGGKVLIEFCERVAEEDILAFFKPTKIKLMEIPMSDDIFRSPYLYINPPQGSISQDKVMQWYAEPGLICTNAGYGGVWSRIVQKATFDRSYVRDTVEWGVNLLVNLLGSRS